MKPKTHQDYMNAAKKLLRQHDVDIQNEKFKEKVSVPVEEEIMDAALTPEMIGRILGYCNPRLRALVLVLASSGMRVGEALQLKVRDVDFESTSVRILIPARFTKTRQARETYITPEVNEVLQQILQGRRTKLDELLFGFSGDSYMAEKKAIQMFRRAMAHIPELNEKIDGSRVHKIHLHSFRNFFFSRCCGVIGEHASHALMGHGFYMQTYFRKPLEERRSDYLKCIPYLTIPASTRNIDATRVQEDLLGRDEKIRSLEQQMVEIRRDAEDFRELMKSLKMSVNGKVELLRPDAD